MSDRDLVEAHWLLHLGAEEASCDECTQYKFIDEHGQCRLSIVDTGSLPWEAHLGDANDLNSATWPDDIYGQDQVIRLLQALYFEVVL